MLSKDSIAGIFKYQKRGMFLMLEPKVIQALGNKAFGGQGLVEKRTTEGFTFSEKVLAEEIFMWMNNFYTQRRLVTEFERLEESVSRVQYFYVDEEVMFIKIDCSINEKQIGNMAICQPLSLVSEELKVWKNV